MCAIYGVIKTSCHYTDAEVDTVVCLDRERHLPAAGGDEFDLMSLRRFTLGFLLYCHLYVICLYYFKITLFT